MRHPLGVAGALDQRRADPDRPLRLVGREDGGVVVRLPGVKVDAVPVDDGREALDHRLVPVAPAVVAAADQLDRRVGALHDERERPGLLDVVLGAQVPDLPAPVHLVAEAPVAHAVGLGMAVGPPEVRPVRVAGAVAVLDPGLGLVHRARPHVHADVGLGAEGAAVLEELVGTEAVRLLRVPGQLAAPGPPVDRPDAVEPVIAADEVAARPSEHRDTERLCRLQHVPAEAARVAQRRALLEDPAVDAAPEVLDEVAVDPPVDGTDPAGQVDRDAGHGLLRGLGGRAAGQSRGAPLRLSTRAAAPPPATPRRVPPPRRRESVGRLCAARRHPKAPDSEARARR